MAFAMRGPEEEVAKQKARAAFYRRPLRIATMRILLALIFLAICTGIAVWDIYCAAVGKPSDTVSSIMQEWVKQHAMLGVAIGTIIGHIFWPTWVHSH